MPVFLIILLSAIIVAVFDVAKETDISGPYIVTCYGLVVLDYVFLKILGTKKNGDKNKAVLKIIEKYEINASTVNSLIEEVKTSIKEVKVFTTWFLGILVTLVVLTITITLNLGSQAVEVYLRTFDNTELRYLIHISRKITYQPN